MPERWLPEPPRRRMSKRGRTMFAWVLGFNLLMLLIAPIGGATLFDALVRLFTKAG
jgi:hypothetical protein